MGQILVIEEDRREFEQIKQCVEAKGHKLWRAANGAEATQFLQQYEVAVILSAINLEDMDVFEFLRSVKSNEQLRNIPFIFYCTDQARHDRYGTKVIQAAGKALGARKYILLSQFNANQFWDELQDCIPERSMKRDALGGQVKTYSLAQISWNSSEHDRR